MFSLDSIRGRLEIHKDYGDYTEKVGEYYNIITRGMGITLAAAMTSGSRTTKDPFSIRYAQLGTAVVDYQRYRPTGDQRYNFFKLQSPIRKSAYGKNLRTVIDTHTQLTVTNEFEGTESLQYTTQQAAFLKIPDSRVTVKKDSGISATVVIDKNCANGITLREIGLFSDNPTTDGSKQSLLVAYKQFSPIVKQSDFSLIFTWTIQVVDFGNVEVWQSQFGTVVPPEPSGGGASGGGSGVLVSGITPNPGAPIIINPLGGAIPGANPHYWRGSGAVTDPPPTFTYGLTPESPWLVELGLPIETRTPVINFPNAFVSGTFGFSGSASTAFSIDSNDGTVSANLAVSDLGEGSFAVSAQPSSVNYNTYTRNVYYAATNPKVTGGAFLGQITWTVPSGAVLGASAVIHCVMPTSSGDFKPSIWGANTNWLVSGDGTSAFSSSGFVAQIHDVVRDSSGGTETVDVIFPTTIIASAGNRQVYDIISTSESLPSATLSIPAYIQNNLYFYVKDLSGYQYKGDIWSGAATTSSILRDGPYKRVYRFYTRMLPMSWDTSAPTNEKKPFALGVHAYLTIKKDDPIVDLDFKISNGNYDFQNIDPAKGIGTVIGNQNQVLGNFYYADLWFEVSTGVSAVSELERHSNTYVQNPYGTWDKYGLVVPEETIPEWQIRNTVDGSMPSAEDFPGTNLSAEQKVMAFNIHGFGKIKKFHRRFRLFPVGDNNVTYQYAREIGQFGDVAFPTRFRTWYKIPKWGPTKDLAPLITDDYVGRKSFAGTHFLFGIGNGYNAAIPIKSNLAGMAGYDEIITGLYRHFEQTAKYGLCRYDVTQSTSNNNYGGIGTRGFNYYNYPVISNPDSYNTYTGTNMEDSNYNWMKRIKTPFTTFGSKNMDIGGLASVHMYKGVFLNNNYLRLLNAETNFTTDRFYGIFDFSGVGINPAMVMNHYGITSTTTTPVSIYEWAHGGYPGFKTVDSNGKPFSFPKIYGARKSNSNLSEPYEDDLRFNIARVTRPDPIRTNTGAINYGDPANYSIVNACKYAHFSMPFNGQEVFNSVVAGYRQCSPEHSSRVFPLMHAITTMTNDEMWKEEFEILAGFYAIAMGPYPMSVSLPVPTDVYAGGGEAFGKPYSIMDFYDVMKTNPAGHGTGPIGRFSNVRSIAFGLGGPTMYYQIAKNDWRNKNGYVLDCAASAFYYSFVRENGLVGGMHIGKPANPNPQDVIDILAAGHSFSSLPTTPDKNYYYYNPSGKHVPNGADVTWEAPPSVDYPHLRKTGFPSIYAQGGIFNVSSLWVTVMQSHYQVYMFRCLAKSVKEFDSVIASGLNYACSSVARTLFKDAFTNFSGCAQIPELQELINNYEGGTLWSELTRPANSTYRNILTKHTIGGNYFTSVDPSKTEGGPPHFLISNTNSWYYPQWGRGTNTAGNGNFTIGNPASGFSGGDFNKFPSKSGFISDEGEYTLGIAAIIAAGDNISGLNNSNEFLNRTAWFKENYTVISSILEPNYTANNYNILLSRALERTRNITPMDPDQNNPSVVGLYTVAPLLAYLQYALGINGN